MAVVIDTIPISVWCAAAVLNGAMVLYSFCMWRFRSDTVHVQLRLFRILTGASLSQRSIVALTVMGYVLGLLLLVICSIGRANGVPVDASNIGLVKHTGMSWVGAFGRCLLAAILLPLPFRMLGRWAAEIAFPRMDRPVLDYIKKTNAFVVLFLFLVSICMPTWFWLVSGDREWLKYLVIVPTLVLSTIGCFMWGLLTSPTFASTESERDARCNHLI